MGMDMRIESLTNNANWLEIAYADEQDIDYNAGVLESKVMRIAHESLDPALVENLIDAIVQILDEARVHRHRVADQFQAPR
jgi:hypothetical protein